MPPQPHRPQALAGRVFRGSSAVAAGLLTRHQLRSSAWIRLRHDVYADARLVRDHALACRAAVLRLPPCATIAGSSAAYLLGVEHAARFTDDVQVIVPTTVRIGRQQGLRVRTTDLDPVDITTGDGLVHTSAVRTAWDVGCSPDVTTAVTIIDTMLRRALVTPESLREVLDRYADRPGNRRAAFAFRLADGRAQSPPESVLRVRLILAGLPAPVPQWPVRLRSGLVLHLELAWPEFKVAVVHDGQRHDDAGYLHRERSLNQLAADGWLVLQVTGRRLSRDFRAVLREVCAALMCRGWRPGMTSRLAG